jgi:hypothetical protein
MAHDGRIARDPSTATLKCAKLSFAGTEGVPKCNLGTREGGSAVSAAGDSGGYLDGGSGATAGPVDGGKDSGGYRDSLPVACGDPGNK